MNIKLLLTTIAIMLILQIASFALFGMLQREIQLQQRIIDAMVDIMAPRKTLVN